MGRGVDHRDRVINYVTKDYNYRMLLEGPYKMERRSDSEEVDPEAWGERVRDAPNAQAAAVAVRTHNPNVIFPRANCREQRAAIERRYTATEVREKLFEEE